MSLVHRKTIIKLFLLALFFIYAGDIFCKQGDTLIICRGDGVHYTNGDSVGATELHNGTKWTLEGADISSSNLDTFDAFYDTFGVFKTYLETYFPTAPTKYRTFTVIVVNKPIPQFHFADTGYCSADASSITLSVPSFLRARYLWSTGETTQTIVASTPGNYWVEIVVSASYTCDSVRRQITVSSYPSPAVNLGKDIFMCQTQQILLDAKGSAGDTYFWSPGNQKTKTITVNQPGIYSVLVTTTDKCTATDQIELIDSCPHLIFMPSAVSPNADLLNDVFDKVWNFTPKEYTFAIYNRWGELLYKTNDMTKGWDCKVKGETVQQDIYVYQLEFLDTDKKWYYYRGTFFVDR